MVLFKIKIISYILCDGGYNIVHGHLFPTKTRVFKIVLRIYLTLKKYKIDIK